MAFFKNCLQVKKTTSSSMKIYIIIPLPPTGSSDNCHPTSIKICTGFSAAVCVLKIYSSVAISLNFWWNVFYP